MTLPVVGATYHHYKGGRYRVLSLPMRECDRVSMVCYQSIETGATWVRPLAEWFQPIDDRKTRFS